MPASIFVLIRHYRITIRILRNVSLYGVELTVCIIVSAVRARRVAGGVGVPVF